MSHENTLGSCEDVVAPGLLKRQMKTSSATPKPTVSWFTGLPSLESTPVGPKKQKNRKIAEYRCNQCPAKFATLIALRIHREREHPEKAKELDKGPCRVCGICKKGFRDRFLLIEHLSESALKGGHDLPIQIHTTTFVSEDEFEVWKDETEKRLGFKYAWDGGPKLKKAGTKNRYYHCHRSAAPNSGFTCSAFCFVKTDPNTGCCAVKYSTDHYGHQDKFRKNLKNPNRVQLPLDLRERVRELLIQGLADEEVRDEIAQTAAGQKYVEFLTAHRLKWIRRYLGLIPGAEGRAKGKKSGSPGKKKTKNAGATPKPTTSSNRAPKRKQAMSEEEEFIEVADVSPVVVQRQSTAEEKQRRVEQSRLRIEQGLQHLYSRVWEIADPDQLDSIEMEVDRLRFVSEDQSAAHHLLNDYGHAPDITQLFVQ